MDCLRNNVSRFQHDMSLRAKRSNLVIQAHCPHITGLLRRGILAMTLPIFTSYLSDDPWSFTSFESLSNVSDLPYYLLCRTQRLISSTVNCQLPAVSATISCRCKNFRHCCVFSKASPLCLTRSSIVRPVSA